MKKVVTIVLIILYSLSYSQEQTNKKFQVGISYSLTNDAVNFKNPINAYVNYQLKRWDNLDVNVGVRTFYYSSKQSAYISNKFGFNPNISTSYFFAKNKLNTYVALGYYFDSFKTTPTITGVIVNPERNITANGLSITPGLKYFVHPNIFLDSNLSLLFAKVEDKFYKTETRNNAFFNVGVGVTF